MRSFVLGIHRSAQYIHVYISAEPLVGHTAAEDDFGDEYQVSSVEVQVSSIRSISTCIKSQVTSVKYQVSGVDCQVSSNKYTVSGI